MLKTRTLVRQAGTLKLKDSAKMTSLCTTIIGAQDTSGNLQKALLPAVEDLKAGYPVAIPTETVYGLAANALNGEACSKIYQVKNRPSDNPLIVHISEYSMLKMLVRSTGKECSDPLDEVDVPERLKPVLRHFWPGPLTVILPKKNGAIPDVVTAGLETVAVRFPRHPIAQKIIEMCGFPLAAPSANLSGFPSPTSADHVMDDLEGRISYIVDGGSSSFGLESTVLDCTRRIPTILRPGSITADMLKPFLPDIQVFNKSVKSMDKKEVEEMLERPSTPGMKYRHYSPKTPLLLIEGPEDLKEQATKDFVSQKLKDGKKVIYLAPRRSKHPLQNINYSEIPLSENGDKEEIAKNLFAGLRAADAKNPDLIVATAVDEDDTGLAIMNRLSKAASETVHIPSRCLN